MVRMLRAAGSTNTQFYDAARVVEYNNNQQQQLIEDIQHRKMNTTLLQATAPEDLQLDEQFKTIRGGYRFTHPAFIQTACMFSIGLSYIIDDLTGQFARTMQRAQDAELARHLWNKIIELRFSQLKRFRIVRDDTRKTIEGAVALRANDVLYNTMYQGVEANMHETQSEYVFSGATWHDSQLTLNYLKPDALAKFTFNEQTYPVYHGYRIETSFLYRATLIANPFLQMGEMVAHDVIQTPVKWSSLFGKGYRTYIDRTMQKFLVDQRTPGNLQNVDYYQSLGFNPDWSHDKFEAHKLKLAYVLSAFGIFLRVAKALITHVLSFGAEAERVLDIHEDVKIYAPQRTVMDLLITALRNEKYSKVAYPIMTG